MKKNLFFIAIFLCLVNFLLGMEDKAEKPETKSNKHLLVDKTLKDYLITEIVGKKIVDLEAVLNSSKLPTELKDVLISEIAMQNPYVIIKYLSKLWHEDKKDQALKFFTSLNIFAQKKMLKKMVKLILHSEKEMFNYFDLDPKTVKRFILKSNHSIREEYDVNDLQEVELADLKDILKTF